MYIIYDHKLFFVWINNSKLLRLVTKTWYWGLAPAVQPMSGWMVSCSDVPQPSELPRQHSNFIYLTWTSCLMSPKEIYCSKDWVFRVWVWVWAGEAVSPCPSLHLHLNMTIFNTRQQGTGPSPGMGPGLATHCQLCHQICLHILPSTLLLIPGISTSRYFTTNGHKHFLKIHFQRIHINCQKHHWGSGFLMMLPADLLHCDKSPDIHNTNIYTVGDTNIAQYIKILYIFSCREPQLRLDWLQT